MRPYSPDQKMRALVTGAAGFMGSHLCDRLLADGHEVVGLDSFTEYYSRTVKERNLAEAMGNARFEFHELDLVEDDLTAALGDVDTVFHLAGRSGVRMSRRNRLDQYVRDNVLATQRLLESLGDRRLRRFVYASSSSVYGDAERVPTKETAVPRPLSFYGVTKLSAENLVLLYSRRNRVPAVSLRFFYVYGPRQRPDMVIARSMLAIAEGREIEIFGDGEQTRDFTFISDAVEATVRGAEVASTEPVFNIGGGTQSTLNAVLEQLEQLAGAVARRRHVPSVPEDHRRGAASINLARRYLTWEPRVSLREGLTRQWQWFAKQSAAEPRSLVAV